MQTELQLVSRKLPFLIVGQLSGVDEGVGVSLSCFNDLPSNLKSGFLPMRSE